MNYTIVQARVLLNRPELALFESSRGDALRALSAKRLEQKIVRTRALRDKYRDLYRRQTVATQKGPAAARAHKGGENERTREKAELFAQVLLRFEDRSGALGKSRMVRAPGAVQPAKPRLSVGQAKRSGGADLPMRGASGVKPRRLQRLKNSASELGEQVVEQRAAERAKTATSKKPAIKTTAAKMPAAKRASPKKTSARPGTVTSLTDAVSSALDQKQARLAGTLPDPAFTPSAQARAQPKMLQTKVAELAQGPAPTDGPAIMQRLNPLKADPGNQKIHASARGRNKAFQAKRDSRSGR